MRKDLKPSSGSNDRDDRQGDGNDSRCYRVETDAANNVVLSGIFTGSIDYGGGAVTSQGSWDALLVKLDPYGNFLWHQRFGDEQTTRPLKSMAANALVLG